VVGSLLIVSLVFFALIFNQKEEEEKQQLPFNRKEGITYVLKIVHFFYLY